MYLLTDHDDFNALASVLVEDNVEGPVYRVGPPHENHGVVAPYTGGAVLFGGSLVRHVLAERYGRGARFLVRPASRPLPADHEPLLVVRDDGRLEPLDRTRAVVPEAGEPDGAAGPGTVRGGSRRPGSAGLGCPTCRTTR
ncbi:hypothetical protein [Streptomyces sp. NPDC058279]|uniref:hypothetical protein n=1 Tax=Streptomyces sp. NPDC058279 TaxID=3346418 RepID=UPI0036F0615A